MPSTDLASTGPPEHEPWGTARAGRLAPVLAAVRGCNYVPSTAVNPIEMWQAATFDRATIERELDQASRIGLNSLRVFLAYLVFREDPSDSLDRLDWLLTAAHRRSLSVMPVLLDDVNFAGLAPALGPQPAPRPGVHNGGWTPSVAPELLADATEIDRVIGYVSSVVAAFADDPRIIAWDLYNEPGNTGVDRRSESLVALAFEHARAARPRQPLTAGDWDGLEHVRPGWLHGLSDVPSFHAYENPASDVFRTRLARVRALGRPALCTEWLHRSLGNTFTSVLPSFREAGIGWYVWGLVAGRTQTWLPWAESRADLADGRWQHDLLRPDGTAWDEDEVRLILEAAALTRAHGRADGAPRAAGERDGTAGGLVARRSRGCRSPAP